jgi:hypothetical protein
MKFLFLTCFLFLFLVQSIAQVGYQIEIKTTNLKDKKVIFSYYISSVKKTKILDSVLITSNQQSLHFKQDKKIINCLYQIKIEGQNEKIDLAVDNGFNGVLALNSANITTIKALNSDLNTQFIAYQLAPTEALRSKIIKTYPNSVAALYLKLEEKKAFYASKKGNYRNEYFSGIDKTDKRFPLLPNFYSFLNDFFKLLPTTKENYKENVNTLLAGIDCKSKAYSNYLGWVFKNLAMHNELEDLYVELFKKYLEPTTCLFEPKSDYSEIAAKVAIFEKLPNGATIPEAEMVDSLNAPYKLSEIYSKHAYTFIAFYDPKCHHCQESMPKLNAFFNTLPPTTDIKKIAFLNIDNRTEWTSFIRKNHLENWLHLASNDPKQTYRNAFFTHANPRFFLIDSKGKIILKSGETHQIKAFLENSNRTH